MALTTPILNSVPAWDKANGQTFTFNVVGGDAVVGNILYILDNSTNTVVYTLTTTSFQYQAVVPANATGLSNGTYYSAYVVTKNGNGDLSSPSNTIQFYCYTTPSWAISNISSGSIVTNSSIAPQASYSQSQGEALSDYTFMLYDSSQTQLATSGVLYTGSSASSQTVTYNFFGLEDNTVYYIRATGHTVEGTVLDTGMIVFTVSYLQPEAYDILYLKNNCQEGYINYYSQAYVIGGYSIPVSPTYTSEGIDLRTNGAVVGWNSGFSIPTNFTLKAWVQKPNLNKILFTLYDEDNNYIDVSYLQDPISNSKGIIMLEVYINNVLTYMCYSTSFTKPTSSQTLCIQIRCVDNIYEVLAEVMV